MELFFDLVGPEQVSPHYENFLHSRRFFFGLAAMYFLMYQGAYVKDLSWILQTTFMPIAFSTYTLYLIMEGRKFLAVPFHGTWYNNIIQNDFMEFER